MSEKKKCGKCGVPMDEVEVAPILYVMTIGEPNTKYERKRRTGISTFKCPNCGFIEMYCNYPPL